MITKLKNNKILKNLINILLNCLIVIFSIVLIIFLYTNIQIRILGHKYSNFFGYSMFEVQSNSMANTIKKGDWIVVKITQDVKRGDIITYETKGVINTHRIVEIYGSTYVTKGDANKPKDDPIDQSQIIGKTIKILKSFGIWRKTILSPAVLITFIITLFLLDSALKETSKPKVLTNQVLSKIFNKLKKKLVMRQGVDLTAKLAVPTVTTETTLTFGATEINEATKEKTSVTEEIAINEIKPAIAPDEVIKEVINISNNEIENDFEIAKEDKDEDLDQTRMFRVIPVNIGEYVAEEAAIAQMVTQEEEEVVNFDLPEEIAEVPSAEGLTNIKLELSDNKIPRGKNIIGNLMNIKKEELNKMISILSDGRMQTNEATIKNAFINTYINAKYYNYYNDAPVGGRIIANKIEKIIKLVAADLMDLYYGSDTKYNDKVYLYANIFKIVTVIDEAKAEEPKKRKAIYRNAITDYFKDWHAMKVETVASEIAKLQRTYQELTKYFLQKFESKTFSLQFNSFATKKNWFATNLKYQINFNKVYSNYIVDKTYSEGIIAEDKMRILLSLLSTQLLKDMLTADFNREYIVYMPMSLYIKVKKFWRLLQIIDDEYAKAHVKILVTYDALMQNKQYVPCIKKLRKNGFKFALAFNESSNLQPNLKHHLYIVSNIFISKKAKNFEEVFAYIPEELLENIIYDDIIGKIDDMGVINS